MGGGDWGVGKGLGKARSIERRNQALQCAWLQGALGRHRDQVLVVLPGLQNSGKYQMEPLDLTF